MSRERAVIDALVALWVVLSVTGTVYQASYFVQHAQGHRRRIRRLNESLRQLEKDSEPWALILMDRAAARLNLAKALGILSAHVFALLLGSLSAIATAVAPQGQDPRLFLVGVAFYGLCNAFVLGLIWVTRYSRKQIKEIERARRPIAGGAAAR